MMLYFQAKLSDLNLAYWQFFQVAYQWRYGKHVMLNDDEAQFLLHGILPRYVTDYLKHLQGEEHARQVHEVPEDRPGPILGQIHLHSGDQTHPSPQ